MTILFSNNASTTIVGGISPSTTTVTLAPGSGIEFPHPITGGNYFVGTFYDALTKSISEIVRVTGISGDTLTIVRGQEGTIARGWATGDIFINNLTAASLANFTQSGGAPSSSTSIIYVGTDVSSIPNLIVCNTNPKPATLQIGMQFNLKLANTNTGPVTAQINGGTAVPVTRSDGSAMVGKELTIAQEMIFIWNGTQLVAMYPGVTGVVLPPPGPTAPPTPAAPQFIIFYVDLHVGFDHCDGLTNVHIDDHHGPCATIQGIILKFNLGIYPPCSDVFIFITGGKYCGGFGDFGQQVGMWHIIGPATGVAVEIYAQVNPPPGLPAITTYAEVVYGCHARGNCKFHLQNLTFYSNLSCIYATQGGTIHATGCTFTVPLGPTAGYQGDWHCISTDSVGEIHLYGNHTFSLGTPVSGFPGLMLANGGQIKIGSYDPTDTTKTIIAAAFAIIGSNLIFPHYCGSQGNGLIDCDSNNPPTFSGPSPTCQPYNISTRGGLNLRGVIFPGSQSPNVTSPGWVTH